MSTAEGYTDPLIFAAISYLIYGILVVPVDYGMSKIIGMYGFIFFPMTNLLTMVGVNRWELIIFINVLVMPILGIISTFIVAAVQYLIYKIFGGTGSYEGTVRVIFYTAAVMVLSWIPILGLILGIYSLYLNIVGGMIVHKVSMEKSTVVVLISTVILTIVIWGLVIAAYLILYPDFYDYISHTPRRPIFLQV